jgi:DNA-binding beta-propeller fold protein YncE
VIDLATRTVTATIPVGLGPLDMSADPSADTVYVGNYEGGTLSVFKG